jgi:hypothetical protein
MIETEILTRDRSSRLAGVRLQEEANNGRIEVVFFVGPLALAEGVGTPICGCPQAGRRQG